MRGIEIADISITRGYEFKVRSNSLEEKQISPRGWLGFGIHCLRSIAFKYLDGHLNS